MITLQEESSIIDRILSGDDASYSLLVDKYKRYAYTIALKVVNNPPDAEEVAQDAFIKAFHYLKTFNRQSKFSTWLYRIVFNTAISHKRKNRVVLQSIDQHDEAHTEKIEAKLEGEDKQHFIRQAMTQLNDADRLAIQLYYLNELSIEEVADIMSQNSNTIKVRIHRARLRLADELKKLLQKEALTL